MGTFKMAYVRTKIIKGITYRYWEPKKAYIVGSELKPCPFKPVKLGDDWVMKADELNKALDKWREGYGSSPRFEKGTIGWLVAEYKKDDAFDRLESNTKTKYLGCLNRLQDKFHDFPADKLSRMAARSYCLSFTTESMPSRMAATCRVLYNFGKNIGIVHDNPFDSMRLSRPKARQAVWSIEVVEAVKSNADKLGMPSIALAIQLGLDTGQRAGDLRTLTWSSIAGGKIRFKQHKTGATVHVPIMKSLQRALDNASRFSPAVLVCEATKKPYSKDMLCRRFRDACQGVEGADAIQFRDLRRTAVVRMAENGVDIAEIAAITGHSINATTNILEVYLPRTAKMAESAVLKLEKSLPHVGNASEKGK